MKFNNDKNNLKITYDLSDDEMNKFYKDAGEAQITIDEHKQITSCKYKDRTCEAEYVAGQQGIVGMMSCGQFIPDRNKYI